MTQKEATVVVPEAIERELNRVGWTWYRLAIESGISHATMYNIRHGHHEAKASNLKSIADALGVSVDSLLSPAPKKSGKKLATVA